MKKAVIYCRVSTDEQAENYSLGYQMDQCRKYAALHEFHVVKDFSDDFTGSVPIEMRPEGKKAFDMLRNDEADVLVVLNMDRLVRPPEDGDEWDTPVLIRSLARLDKEIHTVKRGQLKTDFASLLIAMLDAKSAGEERRKIIERTTNGRNDKARDGKVVGTGYPPYGYRFHRVDDETVNLEPNEETAAVVRTIYSLYVSGDGKRALRLKEITRYLLEHGVKSPYADRKTKRGKFSGEFSAETLRRILSSTTYIGQWFFGKTIGTAGMGGKRDRSEQTPVSVPPIIDKDLWEAAQMRREHNRNASKRNGKRDYLLTGHLKCKCGRAMSGISRPMSKHSDELTVYYACPSRYKYVNDIRGCQIFGIRSTVIERKVIEWIIRLVTRPDELERNLKAAQATQLKMLEPHRVAIEEIDLLIREAQHDLKDNLEMMRGVDPNSRRSQTLVQMGDEIEHRLDSLETRRSQHEAEIVAHSIADDDIHNLVVYARDAKEGLNDPTFEQKRIWLDLLQVTARLTSQNTAVATCLLPVEPLQIDSLTS